MLAGLAATTAATALMFALTTAPVPTHTRMTITLTVRPHIVMVMGYNSSYYSPRRSYSSRWYTPSYYDSDYSYGQSLYSSWRY